EHAGLRRRRRTGRKSRQRHAHRNEESAVEGRPARRFLSDRGADRTPAQRQRRQALNSSVKLLRQRSSRAEGKLQNVHLPSHPHDGTAGLVNSPPFNPLKDRTSRPGLGGGLKNDTTKRHAAAGSDACRRHFDDGKRAATAAWWWRKTSGSACRPASRTAFRTGAAHGSAADVRAADVGTAHVRAANGATHGATAHAATLSAAHSATYGHPARECAAHGNPAAVAGGQPHRSAAAIAPEARVAPADAAVGAGTVQRADADETAAADKCAG